MKESQRLEFVDGVKAVAVLLVFNIHFLNAYYCGIYTLNPADFHTPGAEWWIGATPLNFIYAGKVGARVFLVLSAFLLSFHYFCGGEPRKLLLTPVKKYVRLVAPVLFVNLAVVFLMRAGAYYNAQAAALAGSEEFFGVYNRFEPSLLGAAAEACFGCFLTGSNAYNGPIWFMQYEFLGCTGAALLLYVSGRWKRPARLALYVLLALLLIRTDYLCMVLGAAAGELYALETAEALPGIVDKLLKKRALMWIVFGIGFYFATYPSYGNAEGTIYALFPPKVLFYYNVAIPVMLFALAQLPCAVRFLSRRVFRYLTGISYCFYLIHFPMLCTISAAFFVSMYGKVSYHLLTLMTYILTFTASALLAWLMTRLIDRPMRRAAGAVERRFH